MSHRRSLVALLLTVFLDLAGLGIAIPILPFLAEQFGGTAAQVGMLIAAFSLGQAVALPLWGLVADRIGRRPALLISIAMAAVAHLACGLAGSLGMLLAARGLCGVASGNIAVANTVITDLTEPGERTVVLGWMGAILGLGFIVGPAIGGLFSGFGLSAPFFAAAFLAAVNLVLAIRAIPETRPATVAGPTRIGPGDLPAPFWLLTAALFALNSAQSAMYSTFGLLVAARFQGGPQETGYFLTYFGVIGLVIQGRLLGPLNRRYGERRLLIAGSALVALGMLWMGQATSMATFLGAIAVLAAGTGLFTPSSSALVAASVPAHVRGRAFGLSQGPGAFARVLFPVGAGYLFDRYGAATPYTAAACAGVVMVGICLVYLSLTRQATQLADAAPEGR